ncbi:hypothetical protein FRC07_003792 [Ceratobasidium sp. 392]|nr:hypothetical protein FRC07_003792 [Ceratobasidium sp. 392]
MRRFARPRSPGFRIIDDSPEQDTGLSPSAYITPVTGEIPQGAKLPVVASAPPPTVVPNLPTRVAFLTPDGLKVFVEGSVDGENLSDPLEARLKPEKKGNWSTDYAYFEDDFDKFIDHIRPRFRLLNDPSLAQLPLEEQVKTYLTRPPDDPAGTQVRLLILDGHNGRESASFRIKRNATFRWKNFHNLKVPPQVTVVVTLACCYAATPIEEFILGSGIPKIIALAACDRNETSNADEFKANRFLDALFELLEHGGSERCFDEWEKFLAAVVNNLTKFGTRDQHPVAYIRSEQAFQECLRSAPRILLPNMGKSRDSHPNKIKPAARQLKARILFVCEQFTAVLLFFPSDTQPT